MKKPLSRWSKDVRKGLIEKEMTVAELAERIGYSQSVVASVVSDRRFNSNCQTIAKKINEVLDIDGMPERSFLIPSKEWCKNVRIELIKQEMSIKQLAEKIGASGDAVSLILNGKSKNVKIMKAINDALNIPTLETPSNDN